MRSRRCCPGSGGRVVVESKTLWGACSQGRAFPPYDVCIGAPPPPCVRGAASSHGPVGEHRPVHGCV